MSHRTENRFRQREISRALRAAREADAEVDRVEIDPVSGKISVILAKPDAAAEMRAAHENAAATKAWVDATEAIVKSNKAPKSAPTRR